MTQNLSVEPTIDDDTVQCLYFAPSLDSDQSSWTNLCEKINYLARDLSKEYIWHKDEFKVFLPIQFTKHIEDIPPHLSSITSFGDNIDDEWFIIYIILELTKKYNDIIVQIKDNDGDFLLIEAADHLPSWANPETTENRVFIYNNHIHLIPPNIATLDEKLTLKDAIQLILMSSDKTQASADIEQAILNRVGNYPANVKHNIHNALVEVPLEIATVLKLKPSLIAPIINSYCHHDVIDAKTFKNVSFDNLTTVSVKFTRFLYAMLLYSKVANNRQAIDKDKKRNLGMKLTYGFQMIMRKSTDIYSSKEYFKFLNSLKEHGYFKNNIEGSIEYKILLQNAKDFFAAVECPVASNVCNEITQIMASDEFTKTKDHIKNKHFASSDLMEDNDDWLTIHPEQLNELLNSRYGKKTKFQKGDVITPQAITTELKDFLKQTSDFEGIETHKKDPLDNTIEFDADQFSNCVEKMLKLLSSNNANEEIDSMESEFSDDLMSQSDDEIDQELKEKLQGTIGSHSDDRTILENIVMSMKEEKSSLGPSSNLISSIGLKKSDFLDSDDD